MTDNKLDYKELKEKHPKATALLVEWTKKNLENFQRVMMSQIDVKEDVKIPEITQEHAEKATESLLFSYPRSLMDFFDQNKIEIEIYRGWKYNVDNIEEDVEYNSRIECEIAAFKKATSLLEERL